MLDLTPVLVCDPSFGVTPVLVTPVLGDLSFGQIGGKYFKRLQKTNKTTVFYPMFRIDEYYTASTLFCWQRIPVRF